MIGGQAASIRALDHRHPLVRSQSPVESAVGDVERDHRRGATLEQAVGEPAGAGSDVERPAAAHVESERIERIRELDPAPGDEAWGLHHL